MTKDSAEASANDSAQLELDLHDSDAARTAAALKLQKDLLNLKSSSGYSWFITQLTQQLELNRSNLIEPSEGLDGAIKREYLAGAIYSTQQILGLVDKHLAYLENLIEHEREKTDGRLYDEL